MRDADFYAIRKRENEIEEGIQKIRDGEKYGNLIRQDLHRLDGERHAYEYRRNELENLMNNQRGMAVIFPYGIDRLCDHAGDPAVCF